MRVTTTIERGPVATMPCDQVDAEFSHLIWTNFSGPDSGLTRVGRALQKHSDREGSAFGGLSSGTPIARNEQGMRVLDEILKDRGSTAQVLDNVTNIWDSTGRGIRMRNDGTFMGFLEPLP